MKRITTGCPAQSGPMWRSRPHGPTRRSVHLILRHPATNPEGGAVDAPRLPLGTLESRECTATMVLVSPGRQRGDRADSARGKLGLLGLHARPGDARSARRETCTPGTCVSPSYAARVACAAGLDPLQGDRDVRASRNGAGTGGAQFPPLHVVIGDQTPARTGYGSAYSGRLH